MLPNATLLRIDPPLSSPGPDILAIRCVVADPSRWQTILAATSAVALTLVVYLPTEPLPLGVTPEVGGMAKLQLDADDSETTLSIRRVVIRTGRLGHAELWLAPEGMTVPCPCGED